MTNFEFKINAVKELESYYKQLEKKCKEHIDLIEKEGIARDYSINSDILELAIKIYKTSAILGYIKSFNLEFLDKEKK
jgi:hypothetical protein